MPCVPVGYDGGVSFLRKQSVAAADQDFACVCLSAWMSPIAGIN